MDLSLFTGEIVVVLLYCIGDKEQDSLSIPDASCGVGMKWK
jgi:hypothetical protein